MSKPRRFPRKSTGEGSFFSRPILLGVGSALVLLILLALLTGFAVPFLLIAAGLFFLYAVLGSREGVRKLNELRTVTVKRQCGDEPDFRVPAKTLAPLVAMFGLPYYFLWLIAALFTPVGGAVAWMITALPVLVLSSVSFGIVSGMLREMRCRRAPFWLSQIGICLLSAAIGYLLYRLF